MKVIERKIRKRRIVESVQQQVCEKVAEIIRDNFRIELTKEMLTAIDQFGDEVDRTFYNHETMKEGRKFKKSIIKQSVGQTCYYAIIKQLQSIYNVKLQYTNDPQALKIQSLVDKLVETIETLSSTPDLNEDVFKKFKRLING